MFVLSFCSLAHAQEGLVRQVVPQDSLVMEMPAAVDSTLLGTTIFSLINRNGGDVEINQSASMERAFVKYVENNAKKRLN